MDTEKFQPTFIAPESSPHHLKLSDVFRLSLRVFKVRPLRTVLTILGVSVGIGAVLFLVSLGYGLQYILIGRLATTEDSLITLETFYLPESGLEISETDLSDIVSLPGTGEVSPVAEFPGEADSNGLSGLMMVRIVRPNYFRLAGLKPDFGAGFGESEKAVVVSNTVLKLLGLPDGESALGRKISLKVFYQNNDNPEIKIAEIPSSLSIKGIIVNEDQPPFIIVPNELLIDKPPFFQKVLVKAEDLNTVEALRDKLIEKGFVISARLDLINQARRIMNIITVVLSIFGITSLVVAAIGMFNTMVISFLERIFEVGIMKSIGATARDIRNLFLMESFIMGILGGVGGVLLGIAAGELFNLGLNILAGKPISLFVYPLPFIVLIIILSGAVGVFSGFWPARRAAKLSPKEAFTRK